MILQRVITNDLILDEKIFINKSGSKINTDAYFNAFSTRLWQYLTISRNFFCQFKLSGTGKFQIIKVSEENIRSDFYTINLNSYLIVEHTIRLENDALYYYLEWDRSINLQCAEFVTDCEPKFINLAMITVTYQRRSDLLLLHKSVMKSKELIPENCGIDLYIINNENNTSLLSLNNKNVKVIMNTNTGGSGGFIKGVKAVMGAQVSYTHVLFCDDDITLHPEVVSRTVSLLSLIKPEFKDAVLSGSMFEKEEVLFCHSIFEGLNSHAHHKSILGNLYLDSKPLPVVLKRINNLLYTLNDKDLIYAAWWYACFPVNTFCDYEPLQFFIRGDDQEYGLHIKKKIIALNGIQIWHPAFKGKKSLFRNYLGNRNYAVINILHYKNFRRNILGHFAVKVFRALFNHDPLSVKILSLSFNDALSFNNNPYTYKDLNDHMDKFTSKNLIYAVMFLLKNLIKLIFMGRKIKVSLTKFISNNIAGSIENSVKDNEGRS